MLGALNQRNIVKVYDVCEVNGQTAIIMEYIEGESLSTLLKQAIGWAETWQIIADCAAGLAAAYETRPTYSNAVRTDTPRHKTSMFYCRLLVLSNYWILVLPK